MKGRSSMVQIRRKAGTRRIVSILQYSKASTSQIFHEFDSNTRAFERAIYSTNSIRILERSNEWYMRPIQSSNKIDNLFISTRRNLWSTKRSTIIRSKRRSNIFQALELFEYFASAEIFVAFEQRDADHKSSLLSFRRSFGDFIFIYGFIQRADSSSSKSHRFYSPQRFSRPRDPNQLMTRCNI